MGYLSKSRCLKQSITTTKLQMLWIWAGFSISIISASRANSTYWLAFTVHVFFVFFHQCHFSPPWESWGSLASLSLPHNFLMGLRKEWHGYSARSSFSPVWVRYRSLGSTVASLPARWECCYLFCFCVFFCLSDSELSLFS